MGVEPFLVTASLNSIVAQRLVRVVCPSCKQQVDVPPQALIDLGVSPKNVSDFVVYKGTGEGCKTCSGTGYKGRLAVFEVMEITKNSRNSYLAAPRRTK